MLESILVADMALLAALLPAGTSCPFHPSADVAVSQVHAELVGRLLSPEGLLWDYVGELPTPDDCAEGRPNALGWWTPVENGPMFTGLWLQAMCLRAKRTGEASDRALCRKLAEGLLLAASVSDVPGMVCRGVGTDGHCHYPLGSIDQTLPWLLGLFSYVESGLPPEDFRKRVEDKIRQVVSALEATDWRIPCDGRFCGEFRGSVKKELPFRCATHYLYVLRAMYALTKDEKWLSAYRTASGERCPQTELTYLEVCERGCSVDKPRFPCDTSGVWIYVQAQACLWELWRHEDDSEVRTRLRRGLDATAASVRAQMSAGRRWRNEREVPFRYARWRMGYDWKVQKTQKDAERIAYSGRKDVLGERKDEERLLVSCPLSAAAICAFAGVAEREIAETICLYDYSTVNISEFFMAEVAWWALREAFARGDSAVDFSAVKGCVKPVNGVGQPPMIGMPMSVPMFHYLKEAGIPYSRLHDVGGWQGQHRYVDIPNVFPDFDADENDPKSYFFDCTDILIKNLVENGVEPFYRLGVSIENPWERGMKIGSNARIVPPKDFAKWARVCEHVIRHYTEGWASGFGYKMTYWEIWNEPDNREREEINPLWQAPFSEYVRFYGVVASYLKSRFPHLKIGGYGSCGFYVDAGSVAEAAHVSPRAEHFIVCAKSFLQAARDNGWPLDFFSFHSYSDAPDALRQVARADALLDSYGFTADRTERVFDEWLPVVSHENLGTAKQAAQIAAELIGLQNGPCDMACVYDARCGIGDYSPLFNPMSYKPHKAYYAFLAFNELRKLGRAVLPPKTPTGTYVAAASDGQERAAVMIANISGKRWRHGLDFGPWRIDTVRVVDDENTYGMAMGLPPELGDESVWIVTLVRGQDR